MVSSPPSPRNLTLSSLPAPWPETQCVIIGRPCSQAPERSRRQTQFRRQSRQRGSHRRDSQGRRPTGRYYCECWRVLLLFHVQRQGISGQIDNELLSHRQPPPQHSNFPISTLASTDRHSKIDSRTNLRISTFSATCGSRGSMLQWLDVIKGISRRTCGYHLTPSNKHVS
jgi:hypothetical protein